MFTLKATTLLALPILASAGTSTIAGTRAQRRSELLELLQHNHEKRWEQYNEQPLCEVKPGMNGASFTDVNNDNVGKPLASTVSTYIYSDNDCASQEKCMSACIVDAAQCIGITYDVTAKLCTLLGTGYSGPELSVVPANFQQMTDAGTTSASSGGVSAMTVATCAIKGLNNDNLLSPAENNGVVGYCQCGPGRESGSSRFVCQATGVPQNYFDPADPPQILDGPITTTTPITWSAAYQAVPAVMNNNQCASICAQDVKCQAYLLTPGSELSSCYKIGLSGSYSSPPGFPFTPDTKRVKRQAAGQTGSFGNAGDIFGQPAGSQIDTNKNNHPGPSQKAGLRKRSMRHMGQSQW